MSERIDERGGTGRIGHDAEHGITLIELMIVVAIVALLATVAGVAYTRHIKNSRIVEAQNMIAHIQARQEAYFQGNGSYCNASSGAATDACADTGNPSYHPTVGGAFIPKTWNPPGDGWGSTNGLGVTVDGNVSYFSYVTSAGVSSDSYVLRGDAAALGIAAGNPWYYVRARADMDASGSVYTDLWVTSVRSQVKIINRGH